MSSNVFVACVPHVPFTAMHEKKYNEGMWEAYDRCVAAYDAFDPDVTIVFGGDHYSHVHLKNAPTFMIGHVAEAGDDCGGFPGKLDVPMALSRDLADALIDDGFDLAVSFAMKVDHGFSNVIGHFGHGNVGARAVIPVHINTLTTPRPTLKRCRQLGEAVGRWAKASGKRVAFLGSGGLSHQTDFFFPQYDTAPDEATLTYIVHGGGAGPISEADWHDAIDKGMNEITPALLSGELRPDWVNCEWDRNFLDIVASGDLTKFDSWSDQSILDAAGYGGSEIRLWIAALAAGRQAGGAKPEVDYYSDDTTMAVGVGVAHMTPAA